MRRSFGRGHSGLAFPTGALTRSEMGGNFVSARLRQAAGGKGGPPPAATGDGETDRERAAKVHAIYRAVNANIVVLMDRFTVEPQESNLQIHCECGRNDCTETVNLQREEQDRARAVPTHFIVATGHAPVGVERIVQENGQHTVVELGADQDSVTDDRPDRT